MSAGLFDTHNHLQDFAGRPDFEKILGETRAAGVSRMVVNGSTEGDWPVVAELARRYPDLVIPAFGLHPWHIAKRTPEWRATLEKFLCEFPGAAVGEIGLDRWIPEYDWDDQVAVFLDQWRLAVRLDRVAEVHCLRAFGHLEQLVRTEPNPRRGWILHSYGGPEEMVPTFASLGASFSFSGYFLHPRKIEDRAATFRRVPRDRLLVETDAPDMAPPEDLRCFPCPPGPDGKPENHPGNLAAVASGLAGLLGMTPEELTAITTENARRLFEG